MRVLLICVGSRGDAEPFCSLADRLLESGHEVDFFIQPDLEPFAPSGKGLTIHQLPFTQMDFYKFVGAPSHGADHENPRVRFVGTVVDIIAALVLPCRNEVLEIAQHCQVIVTTALARSLCFAVSEKTGTPVCLLHLQPLIPTSLFPHSSNTDDFIMALSKNSSTEGSKRNLDSYWELEKYQHNFLLERLNAVYDEMDLPHLTFIQLQTMLIGNHPRTIIANSFYSPELLPMVQDAGDNVHHVGPLADAYIPKAFAASDHVDLLDFLDEYRPICIGYGSMPCDKVKVLLQALHKTNRKAVLVGDAIKIPSDEESAAVWARSNVRHVSSLPYAWLLPKCEMMLCHGGAGVVHATLRAGIPVVISPFMGDQFFYAKLCEMKGIGTKAGNSLTSIRIDEIVVAVEEASTYIPAAQAFGEKVHSKELGVDRMLHLLEFVAIKE